MGRVTGNEVSDVGAGVKDKISQRKAFYAGIEKKSLEGFELRIDMI